MAKKERTAGVIQSMTGFCSVEGEILGRRHRLEIKTLNHRFLDLKIRLPREFAAHEMLARSALQAQFQRGSLELKLERLGDASATERGPELNLSLAAHYYESMITLQKTLGLSDAIRTADLASFPEVFRRPEQETPAEEAWPELEKLLLEGCQALRQMRTREGEALKAVFEAQLNELEASGSAIRARRADWEGIEKSKIQDRIRAVFEAYPVAQTQIQAVLESRIAQELALLLDRSDIEEELARLEGHIAHFRKLLAEGGAAGRKLDFLAQEMGREVNTLSNKATDLSISEIAVPMKVKLEQIREQVMNLE